MRRLFLMTVGVFFCLGVSSWAQYVGGNGTQPPPGTISSRPANGSGYIPNTNYSAGNNLTLTNGAGGAFSVEQLGSQLQALRATVDQTLPMLSAFNQRYSAAQPGSTLGRAVQNIFSGNKSQQGGNTAGQEITNVLAALGALVNTNNQNVSATTLKDLATLEKDLQPVEQVLRSLSFTGTTNQGYGAPVSVPLPTGR